MARILLAVAVTAVVGLGLGGVVGALVLARDSPAPTSAAPPPMANPIGDPDATPVTFDIPRFSEKPRAETPSPKPALPAGPPRDPVECRALRIGFAPAHFAVTTDHRYLLLASRETDRVVVWDWAKDEEEKRIPVEAGPCFILVRGGRAYVCNGNASTISVIDVSSLRVVDTFKLPAGQPRYMTAASDRSAPAFVSCGDAMNAGALVRLDLATGKSSVVPREQGWGMFTVHSNGKLAAWQGENGTRWLYEVGSGSTLKFLAYRSDYATGVLFPDRKGKFWFGAGSVWDAGLTKQVAKLDNAPMLTEHPSEPLLVALDPGQPYNPYPNRIQYATVTFYDANRFTSVFTHRFALPPLADGQNPYAYSHGTGWNSQPLVVSGSFGTVVFFRYRQELARLLVPPEAYVPQTVTRLASPFPKKIPSGLSWSFKLAIADVKGTPTFKAIEIPDGSELKPMTGELTWECPTTGEYDFVVKVVLATGEDFVIEEHLSVEGR